MSKNRNNSGNQREGENRQEELTNQYRHEDETIDYINKSPEVGRPFGIVMIGASSPYTEEKFQLFARKIRHLTAIKSDDANEVEEQSREVFKEGENFLVELSSKASPHAERREEMIKALRAAGAVSVLEICVDSRGPLPNDLDEKTRRTLRRIPFADDSADLIFVFDENSRR